MKTHKISRVIQFLLIGTSVLTMTACDEKPKDKPFAFKDEQECRKIHTEEECKKALEESKAKYAETAPKFTSKEECEKQYGPGKCAEGHHEGGHGLFMPMMMGFMMGRMMGGVSQPALPPVVGQNPTVRAPSKPVKRGGFGSRGTFRSSGS